MESFKKLLSFFLPKFCTRIRHLAESIGFFVLSPVQGWACKGMLRWFPSLWEHSNILGFLSSLRMIIGLKLWLYSYEIVRCARRMRFMSASFGTICIVWLMVHSHNRVILQNQLFAPHKLQNVNVTLNLYFPSIDLGQSNNDFMEY